jgi:hypothetical protein
LIFETLKVLLVGELRYIPVTIDVQEKKEIPNSYNPDKLGHPST